MFYVPPRCHAWQEVRFRSRFSEEGKDRSVRLSSVLFGFRGHLGPFVGLGASSILDGWAGFADASSVGGQGGKFWVFITARAPREA